MEFLGMAAFISLMTFSTLGNAQPPPVGGTCLPDVYCTLMLHYITPGDTPCTGTALRDSAMVKNKPVITWNDGTAVRDDETYILIMADPDAPHPCRLLGFWLHWVTEATFDSGTKRLSYGATDLLPYQGPSPPLDSDAHRYQVMVYKVIKRALVILRKELELYGARRYPGVSLSGYLSSLGLKSDEPPLASYQFCFSTKPDSGTCRTQPSPFTTTQAPTTNNPPSAESTTVKSVFQKTTLVLVYSVVLGWMNS